MEAQFLLPVPLLIWEQQNVDVYMVNWRGCKVLCSLSATPDHLACLLKACLCWHQELNLNAKAVLTQPSCLRSSADGEAASSSAPLFWEMSVREGWGETTTPWQAGDFPRRTGLDLFIGSVTPLGWGRPLFLPSRALTCAVQYTTFYFFSAVVLFSFVFSLVTVLVDVSIVFAFGVACWTLSAFAEFLACVSSADSREVCCTTLSSVCPVM